MPTILAFILGYAADYYGRRITAQLVGNTLLFSTFIIFILVPTCDRCYTGLIPLVLLGISASISYTYLWPMYPLVVKPHVVGIALGLICMALNAGLAIIPIIVGKIMDATDDVPSKYTNASYFLGAIQISGFINAGVLYYTDRKYHGNI